MMLVFFVWILYCLIWILVVGFGDVIDVGFDMFGFEVIVGWEFLLIYVVFVLEIDFVCFVVDVVVFGVIVF